MIGCLAVGDVAVNTMSTTDIHVRKPADFENFWENISAVEAAIPLDDTVVRDDLRSAEDVDVYRVNYESIDSIRIHGWYCLPKKRTRPLPAVLHIPGYQSDPILPKNWSRLGFAAFSVAPRGKVRSRSQFNPGYPGLLAHNITDRDTYGYRGFYVDVLRAVDFLESRDEVDSSRIAVTGSSQGGGLAIMTAAMRPQVAAATAAVPYLCDMVRASTLTDSYPYQEITDYLRLHPGHRRLVEETLSYYDVINFAPQVRCPIIVNIGLQDSICPPETGFSVFEALGSEDKKLYTYDGQSHDGARHVHNPLIDRFLMDKFGMPKT
ncbi:MAG: acetylxylan esterase [Chloroflexi bacterium]|nr:acetylxylan esterase [Chloroflexota bacterium]